MDEPEITEVGLRRPDGGYSIRSAGPAIREEIPDDQWAADMAILGVQVYERVVVVKVEWHLRQPQDQAADPTGERPAVQGTPGRRQISA